MGAVSKIRESWSRAKLRVRLGRWKIGSPIIEIGTNAEILPYQALQERREALQDRRFDEARKTAERRLQPFQATSPQYPPVSPGRISNEGFRKNAIVRRCVEMLCESVTMAKPIVENLNGSVATSAISDKIREFMAFPSGRERSGPRGSVGPFLWWDILHRLVQDLYTAGNGMLEWVDGVGTPDPVRIWRLPPDKVWIQPHEEWSEKIRNYVLELDGVLFEIPRERVIHTRFWDPQSEYWGIPPLWSALRDLTSDNEQTDFTAVTIQNLGVPPAVIEYDQDFIERSGLDPHTTPSDAKSLMSLRDLFADMYGGRQRGKMAIGWGFKVKLIGLNMRDLDISSLVRISETRIAMVHGVPNTLLGRSTPESDRPGAATRQMKEVFFTGTITGLVNRIESIFSPRIVAAFDPLMRHRIRFDLSGVDVIREMTLKRWREAGQVFQSGIASRATCQRAGGIPVHGTEDEFVPLKQATTPERLPGDQGEGVGP